MEDADWTVRLRRDDKIYLSVSRQEETEQINKGQGKGNGLFFSIDVIIAMSHCYYNEDAENKNV